MHQKGEHASLVAGASQHHFSVLCITQQAPSWRPPHRGNYSVLRASSRPGFLGQGEFCNFTLVNKHICVNADLNAIYLLHRCKT